MQTTKAILDTAAMLTRNQFIRARYLWSKRDERKALEALPVVRNWKSGMYRSDCLLVRIHL